MSILIDETTTFIVQGITGREAVNLTRECLDYGAGAKVVGGVTPGRLGREVHGVPVFDTVAQAVEHNGAPINGSVVTVPPAFTKDAVFEAIENGVKLVVIVTERIPRRDVAEMVELAALRGARIIGPNCLGVTVPSARFNASFAAHMPPAGDLALISRILRRPGDATRWDARAEERRSLMDRYLWDESTGLYLDYDVAKGARRNYPFATTFYPLWVGAASPAQAARVAGNLKRFEAEGGLLTSTTTSGSQWDAPFGWAPLQLIAVPAHTPPLHRGMPHTFDADATYSPVRHVGFRAGYTREEVDRTYRIVENTTEDIGRVSVDLTGLSFLSVRGVFEHGKRRGTPVDGLELLSIGEQPTLRQYDISDRDSDRFSTIIVVTPLSALSFNTSVGFGRQEYPGTNFGLRNNDNQIYSLGFDYVPTDRVSMGLTYGFEKYTALQASRTANPLPANTVEHISGSGSHPLHHQNDPVFFLFSAEQRYPF
jgi:hypothetical protein